MIFMLQGVPEQIGICLLAFIISQARIDWKVIILCGFVLAFIAFIIRSMPVIFGLHTIILLIVLFLMVRFLGDTEVSISLIACLVSFAALIVIETLCLNFILPQFGVNISEALNHPSQRVLITLPQVISLYVLALIVYKLQKKRVSQ